MEQIPDFIAAEDVDGVRFSWNAIPQSKLDANRLGIPIGAIYTPLKQRDDIQYIDSNPVVCKQPCGGVLNPFSTVNPNGTWVCPICSKYNPLPPSHQGRYLPELDPQNTTVEYILSQKNINPPIFLYVIDLCLSTEDFEALKEQILLSLNYLPPNALVGILTFGKNVEIYEINSIDVTKTYAFNGQKEYTADKISQVLGFVSRDLKNPQLAGNVNSLRFLKNPNEAEYVLSLILENLSKDEWLFKSNQRSLRSTGAALHIAQQFLAEAYPKSGAQIMLFSGGPCTYGPGLIVTNELKEPIRSHHLIESGDAKHYKKAIEFYNKLSRNCNSNGTTVNVFIGAYDQIGLLEMENLVKENGGRIVLSDSFTTSIFKQSLQKFLTSLDANDNLIIGLNSTLEVKASKEIKITGFIGNGLSLEKNDHFVSKTSKSTFGLKGTSAWKLSTIYSNSSFAVFFDLEENLPQNLPSVIIQFVTFYHNVDGTTRLKVTTVSKQIKFQDINRYFDQEAAVVLVSRIAVNKLDSGSAVGEVLKYVDDTLIDFLKRFATYIKNDINTFSLIQEHSLLPQFIYHLKRSQFLQNFNNSPDETVFYRNYLNLEDTNNSLIMIQPTLTAFDQDRFYTLLEQSDDVNDEVEYGEPVLLDSISILPGRILLLDTFFHILIFHGDTISTWKNQGYQNMEEYESFAKFLEIPRLEAANLLVDRFPLPRFIDCNYNDSQSRFLYSKLNPSNSQKNDNFNGLKILTEDISLQDYLTEVQKRVTQG
ncbi:hypothetical protein WICMUC_001717 [Wickerhamomyces mucosus]|uniref:Protein transport protein SEC23 n=1 Tax=Wickerhamomyces mucosus TaxID=1378264 RepID=A0A9P8TG73_9ASCO|nr:hypothetical protein WICMUC_001717 [Wickerhamomyces mucosus]